MSKNLRLTNGQISMEVAADVLASGQKSVLPPTHPSMGAQSNEYDPAANSTDASDDDDSDWSDDNG